MNTREETYNTVFTLEDFDNVVREFEAQYPPSGGFIFLGSKEQIEAYYEEGFWPAMEKAAIVYLNSRTI